MNPFQKTEQANSVIGVGLRHSHYSESLSDDPLNNEIDFVEIHAENFFAKGGISKALLSDVAQQYKVSVHGTSLGLGSNLAVPEHTLEQFAQVVEHSNAYLVSEHLCFNRAEIAGNTLHSGDLLPIAYNQASFDILANNIDQIQNRIKRPILIENLSAYIKASALDENAQDEMDEIGFLSALCQQAGCGLLLDLNNMIVNAINQKLAKPVEHIQSDLVNLPAQFVGEIHLAGFSPKQVNGFVVDDHANEVSDECWQLYQWAIEHFGKVPTLIEWDNNLPSWHELLGQATKARQLNVKP